MISPIQVIKNRAGMRITLISLLVFGLILFSMALIHKMARNMDPVRMVVEHIFEPAPPHRRPLPDTPEKDGPGKGAMEAEAQPRAVGPKELPQTREGQADQNPMPSQAFSATEEVSGAEPQPPLAEAGAVSDDGAEITASVADLPSSSPPRVALESLSSQKISKKEVTLASKLYFDALAAWQQLGQGAGGEAGRVGLSLHNLEDVYELFQMKVVAVKDGVPHTDLADGSRVALPALEEFSSTCFLVSSPWEKWGRALARFGFKRGENVQVRYYTYGMVRNAIYARAFQAFEWGLNQLGLPRDTPPTDALVTGRVWALNRAEGGRFGVFVPGQVAFSSGQTIAVDPGQCFADDRDVGALMAAGLL
ncbi:MAG: hypothetical protein MI747_25485 [Desulfobacterales bacterium]|nr:hypothetical protein [Desulfobacterales bacterium]